MILFLRLSFLLSLVSIEKIHQTLKTLFNHISTHLEARKNYSATRRVFSYLLGVSWNVVKHGLSCLIYYFVKHDSKTVPSFQTQKI